MNGTMKWHLEWMDIVSELEPAQRAMFYEAIVTYYIDGTLPHEPLLRGLLANVKSTIAREKAHEELISQKRSIAGRAGGIKHKGNQHSKNGSKCFQMEAKKANASEVTDTQSLDTFIGSKCFQMEAKKANASNVQENQPVNESTENQEINGYNLNNNINNNIDNLENNNIDNLEKNIYMSEVGKSLGKAEGDSSSKSEKTKIDFDRLMAYYNQMADGDFVKVMKMTDARKTQVKARVEEWGKEKMIEAIRIAKESDFLCGRTSVNFKMTFDFLVNKTKFTRILEGAYNNPD